MEKLADKYGSEYFRERHTGNDIKREQSYQLEFAKITKYVSGGKVLDVGCGMGNFLDLFDGKLWDKYGIEISDYARELAERKNIKFIDYNYDSGTFDLIIFRGVVQHLDEPLHAIKQCLRMLKPGGYMAFLATPNTNAIHYRLFKELPMLDPSCNFMLPSDKMMVQTLRNFNMEVVELNYPYLESPYSNPVQDHAKFLLRLLGIKKKFPFWKNMMEIFARKI